MMASISIKALTAPDRSSAAPMLQGYWEGFAFAKRGTKVLFQQYLPMDRNPSMMDMIHRALALYPCPDFDWVVVNVGDRDDFDWVLDNSPAPGWIQGADGRMHALFSFCTTQDNFDSVIPDFIYDHWKSTGLDDYEQTAENFHRMPSPKTAMIGWRGADTHPTRKKLVELHDGKQFDFEFVHWDRTNEQQLTATNFLSLEDQVLRWRYLLDVRGNGYSGRLKLLLHAPRVVFVQERCYKDDTWEHLVPWRHYVPVSEDFSDLADHLERLKSDPALERLILDSAAHFARAYLTRTAAYQRIAWLVRNLQSRKLPEALGGKIQNDDLEPLSR